MRTSLRQLFILAVFCSAGLLGLQAYWIMQEWKRGRDILERQVDYAFQQAVEKEWNRRKDTLSAVLRTFLYDSSFIRIGTKYNKTEKVWMITMYDPANPSDYSSWTNAGLPVGKELLPGQKEQVIDHYISANIRKNVATDVIYYYTQRFGKAWAKKHADLRLDTSLVAAFFKKELRSNNINTAFRISYRDTTADKKHLSKTNSTVLSAETPVNFASLNDYDKKYLAVGVVQSPSVVLLGRMWLAISASVILLVLTLFCLHRMYRIILRQKKLDQLKDDFISNMTHELKTPIATVSAAIDGLQYYEALEDRDRTIRYLNASRVELNKLDEMVSKVLELSTSESADQPLRKESFLLRGFLEDIFSSFQLQPSFSWQMNIDEDLHVWGDRGKLESVFVNLISNAIKYGHNTVEVSVSAYEENKQLRIAFADNGPGIDSIHLPYLFNKFYRGDPGFSSVKGFGLGLFYVRNIITAHGGEISAYNEKGLRFLIQLPKKA